jgi:prepilin-type N-terminal cleavage/methylation domain-containing protein
MNKGFTLLELLVSISIIMLLTVSGMAAYGSVSKNSRDSKRKSDIEQLRQALEMYRSDLGYYPITGNGAYTPVTNLGTGVLVSNYLPSIPTDPRYTSSSPAYPYQYRATTVFNGQYYGYCVCAVLESLTATSNNCSVGTPGTTPSNTFYYCVRSP